MRLVFKDFPLPSHDLARPAHEAARCAATWGKFWPYHDRLFQAQPNFRRADLVAYAVELGIEREPFTRCLEEGRFAAAVAADVAQARARGGRRPPTLVINGRRLVGAQPVDVLREAIDDALQGRR